jgi:EAL domain-containing protein (putative c-di-GMP-specific phosphodiesterase class I)
MHDNLSMGPDPFSRLGDPVLALVDIETRGQSVGDKLCQALHSVRLHLEMDVAFVAEFAGGSRVFRYVDGASECVAILAGVADPLCDTYCERVLDGRFPQLIPDTSKLPAAAALPITAMLSIGAYIGVPIRFSDGQLYGTLCCFRKQPDETLNERDLGTLRLFAEFSGRLLETQARHEREYESMRASICSVLNERLYSVVYQPIVDITRNRIVGYEALARFQAEPHRAPDIWFGDADRVGLQCQLETVLIQEALKGLEQISDAYLSINVSPGTVLSGALDPLLEGLPLERLMLEITEHTSIPDYEPLSDALAPMRESGLTLAVDDAGAGYASFRHILQLKPDVIKLDGSLIRNIDSKDDCRALAAALIRFGQETGSRIVAECVETRAELDILRQLQVTNVQGYLLGRPMPLGGGQMS